MHLPQCPEPTPRGFCVGRSGFVMLLKRGTRNFFCDRAEPACKEMEGGPSALAATCQEFVDRRLAEIAVQPRTKTPSYLDLSYDRLRNASSDCV